MKCGIEVLLESPELLRQLEGRRVALVGHPASVDQKLNHSLHLLHHHPKVNLTCAFGPQHGMMGDKQYNMEESPTYVDQDTGVTVHSLYGDVRRPTDEMMQEFDTVLFDLQDVGCRIYTYVATLVYMLEACAQHGKSLWVLDRPNPVGRPMDGTFLEPQWLSFVGEVETIMQHGLTLGELALWYKEHKQLDMDLQVVNMQGYHPNTAPGWGWDPTLPWVNPSPQIPNLSSCRVYNGTVLLEATHLSEGRGTTVPLQVLGAPQLQVDPMIQYVQDHFADWLKGSVLRKCFFVPFFNKHEHQLCEGLQIHVDVASYDHTKFKPYRLMAGLLKAIRQTQLDFQLWNDFHYEYEKDRSPIHLLTGSTFFKEWVDDSESSKEDFDARMQADITEWEKIRQPYLLY